nr:3-deoxy-7-phosphoheptulonate synthase [Cyclobacteriaceae bacterium]
MIIQLEGSATAGEKERINRAVVALGYKTTAVKTQVAEYVIGIGKKDFDIRQVGSLPGIADIHRVSDDYKLVSRKWKVNRTVIGLGDGVEIGNGAL